MDVRGQYSLVPYVPSQAVVPAAEGTLLQARPEAPQPTSERRFIQYSSNAYLPESDLPSSSYVYTPGQRLSAIDASKVGSLIDVYA